MVDHLLYNSREPKPMTLDLDSSQSNNKHNLMEYKLFFLSFCTYNNFITNQQIKSNNVFIIIYFFYKTIPKYINAINWTRMAPY